MSAGKWTPDPWQIRDADPTQVCDSDGEVRGCAPIASCDYGAIRERKANARLIAAAPELLKELDHLVKLLAPMENSGTMDIPGLATLNGARSAIKKARGES